MTDFWSSTAGPPPTASLNKRVTREAQLVDDEGDAVVGMSRRRERLHAKVARLDGARRHLEPIALHELVVAGDVIGVPVRQQQVRRRQPMALDRLDQRLERGTAVHEDGDSALLGGEDVRVREPGRMQAPLDEHGGTGTERPPLGVVSTAVRTGSRARGKTVSLGSESRMRRIALVLVALAFVVAVAACGGEEDQAAEPETTEGTLPETTETDTETETTDTGGTGAEGDPVAGKEVFVGAGGCGSCHTFSDAGTSGTIGPTSTSRKPASSSRSTA